MTIYFVYHRATDYYYDNGVIIGASTDEKEYTMLWKRK